MYRDYVQYLYVIKVCYIQLLTLVNVLKITTWKLCQLGKMFVYPVQTKVSVPFLIVKFAPVSVATTELIWRRQALLVLVTYNPITYLQCTVMK